MEIITLRAGLAAGKTFEGITLFLQGKALEISYGTETLDQKKLATLDQEGKVRIWDAETGTLLATASGTYVDPENRPTLQFSETGNALTITDRVSLKILYFSPDDPISFVEVKRPRTER